MCADKPRISTEEKQKSQQFLPFSWKFAEKFGKFELIAYICPHKP